MRAAMRAGFLLPPAPDTTTTRVPPRSAAKEARRAWEKRDAVGMVSKARFSRKFRDSACFQGARNKRQQFDKTTQTNLDRTRTDKGLRLSSSVSEQFVSLCGSPKVVTARPRISLESSTYPSRIYACALASDASSTASCASKRGRSAGASGTPALFLSAVD